MSSDRIEKRIVLRAPLARVWRALSDATEFGVWFGVEFEQAFAPGSSVRGRIVPTRVDAEVAKAQKVHENKEFNITIEQMEPESLFSFRWHPFAVEPDIDYSGEPATLVEFRLEDGPEGVVVTLTESGFDRIPLERRLKAFAANEGGWSVMGTVLEKYLVQTPSVS